MALTLPLRVLTAFIFLYFLPRAITKIEQDGGVPKLFKTAFTEHGDCNTQATLANNSNNSDESPRVTRELVVGGGCQEEAICIDDDDDDD